MEDLETQIAHVRALALLKARKRLDQKKKLEKDIVEYKAILADPTRTGEHEYTAKCLEKATLLDKRLATLIAKHLEYADKKEETLKLEFELLDTLKD